MNPFDESVELYGLRLVAIPMQFSTAFALEGEVKDKRLLAAVCSWIRRYYGYLVLLDTPLDDLVEYGYLGYADPSDTESLVAEVQIRDEPFEGSVRCTWGEF